MDLSSAVEDADARDFQSASPGGSDNETDQGGDTTMSADSQPCAKNGNAKPPTSNPKDPNRPRRKKARRACFACQRAHLTCGDERPCQRCIKRGLADACQDGVRKKAKYLHDAPNEALLPGAANHYTHDDLKRSSTSHHNQENIQPQQQYFQDTQPFPLFTTTPMSQQMPPPQMHERTQSFGQQSSSGFSMSQPMQSPTSVRHTQPVSMPGNAWAETLFGAEDPSLFNFDLASMNFGNHYGALEFGMLGKMATGAGDTPDSDIATQRGSIGQYQMPFGSISESPHVQYGDGMMDWTNGAGMYGHMQLNQRAPNAFAIESNVHNFTSPDASSLTPDHQRHDDPPMLMNIPKQQLNMTNQQATNFLPLTSASTQEHIKASIPAPAPISTPRLKAQSQLPAKAANTKRARDPSSIYTNVTSPYPYTTGFHSLIAYLQKRFARSPSKTLAIAKSLASIRPSFIATTKTLNRDDLIFMEKCFQRTLWEYEGFIESVGTPTIVARRTGEIAAVGKEFQILTGWRKNVLLGQEPNLNVNTGHSGETPCEGSGANTRGRATGTNTPARRHVHDENNPDNKDGARQQPVFLAELFDDDAVVKFYEDFARLAFGDSRGSVMGKGKLLKYQTKDDQIAANLIKAEQESLQRSTGDLHKVRSSASISPTQTRTDIQNTQQQQQQRPDAAPIQGIQRMDSFASARLQDARKGISGEKGMQKLGSMDGKVECTYCWTIKRDVFDIPMLLVISILPII